MDNIQILYTIFIISVPLLLGLDLWQNRKPHVVQPKEAIGWSAFWVAISIVFGLLVWRLAGPEKGAEFFTAYGIEKMLSVDNLFVFALIFSAFKVDEKVRHKVLFYGILGAILFRAIFIFLGVEIIKKSYLPSFQLLGLEFHEPNLILLLFGFFLIFAGYKSMKDDDDEVDLETNKAVVFSRWLFSKFRYTGRYYGGRFTVYHHGKRYFTLLAFVVLVIEVSDLVFAVDSIPAIFTVSTDPFILYSSNIYAILGLRALYFLLDVARKYFKYLPYGVAGTLIFIGLKMVTSPLYHIEALTSLFIVLSLLLGSIVFSILRK
jgi:tellurite resistance protein TerC